MKFKSILFIIISIIFLSACKDKNTEDPISLKLDENNAVPYKEPNPVVEDSKEESIVKTNQPAKALTIGMHKVVAKNGLNLRTETKKESPAIVRMNKNTEAEILEYTNIEEVIEGNKARWAKVKFKKYTGYAFSYYLEPLAGVKTITPSQIKKEAE